MKYLLSILLGLAIIISIVGIIKAQTINIVASVKPYYEIEEKGNTLIIRTNMQVLINP